MTGAVLPSQCSGDLLDIAGAVARWRRAMPGPMNLSECRSAGGSWGCKWGCKDQRASLSADFTCLFKQRPRQEASPHNSAVPIATPLLIVAHPLPDSFEQRGEVETFECWRRERRGVCVSLYLFEARSIGILLIFVTSHWIWIFKHFKVRFVVQRHKQVIWTCSTNVQ